MMWTSSCDVIPSEVTSSDVESGMSASVSLIGVSDVSGEVSESSADVDCGSPIGSWSSCSFQPSCLPSTYCAGKYFFNLFICTDLGKCLPLLQSLRSTFTGDT